MRFFLFVNCVLFCLPVFAQGQDNRCNQEGDVMIGSRLGGEVKELYECRSGRYRWLASDKARRFLEAHRGDTQFANRMKALSECEFEECLARTREYDSVTFQANANNPEHVRFLEYFATKYRNWLQSQSTNSSSSTLIYSNCTQVGEAKLGYFNNGNGREYGQVCQIMVKGCKEGDSLIPGTVKAYCDHGACDMDRRWPPRCDCPTDPNECVNDDAGDGKTNYTNVARIPFTVYQSDYFLSQITEAAKQNRSIIEELQSVSCNRVQGRLKRVRISFNDGETMNILPIDSFSGTDYQLTFLHGCIGASQFMDECSQRKERQISISPNRNLSWRSPDNKTYPIQSVDQGGSLDNCNVQRNLRAGNVNILSRGGRTRSSGGHGQGN